MQAGVAPGTLLRITFLLPLSPTQWDSQVLGISCVDLKKSVMLCPEERLWTPGFSCQLHFYLQGSLRLLCQRLWPVQPTTCPSSIRSTAILCRVSRPPLPRGLCGCDPLFHKPHSVLRSSGASRKLGRGPQE